MNVLARTLATGVIAVASHVAQAATPPHRLDTPPAPSPPLTASSSTTRTGAPRMARWSPSAMAGR